MPTDGLSQNFFSGSADNDTFDFPVERLLFLPVFYELVGDFCESFRQPSFCGSIYGAGIDSNHLVIPAPSEARKFVIEMLVLFFTHREIRSPGGLNASQLTNQPLKIFQLVNASFLSGNINAARQQ